MNRYMSFLSVFLAAACLVAFPAVVRANVYASGVTVDSSTLNDVCGTATVTYILNENANGDGTRPGVKIEVLDSSSTAVRTVTFTRQAKGKHAWQWDGRKDDGTRAPSGADKTYSFRITAADTGYATWTQTSTQSTGYSFYYPRSVAVNKNVASPHYGKIYVTENNNTTDSGATAFGRTTKNGIYCITADGAESAFSNAVDPTGTIADWTHDGTGFTAPWKANIGQDDHLYVTSYYDDLAFDFAADLSSVTQLIDGTNKDVGPDGVLKCTIVPPATTCTNDDQFVGSIVATGSQAAGDRIIYLLNYNYFDTLSRGVRQYSLGSNAKATSGDLGTQTLKTSPYYGRDIERDSAGNFYVTNYRSKAGEAPGFEKFDTSGAKVTPWSCPTDMTNVQGLGMLESKGWMAVAMSGNGTVRICDLATGAVITTVAVETTTRNVHDVAFDAAGNMYTISNNSEWLRAWSPPDGANHKDTTTASFVLNKSGTGGPAITSQPQDASFCPGGSTTLTVAATGTGLTYVWQKDGVDLVDGTNGDGVTIAGATTATLNLSNVASSYNGAVVGVKVCSSAGVVESRLATLRIGVFFAQSPASVMICQNSSATFSVLATGKGTLSYNWQRDEAGNGTYSDFVPPATGTSVTLNGVQTAMSGTNIRCVVTDECGSVTSPTATLTVKGNPSGLAVYFAVEQAVGKNAHFYCTASGTGVLHYQWYKNVRGVKTAIGTDAATVDYTVEACDNWYDNGILQLAVISCLVTDDCGSAEIDRNGTTICTLKVTTGGPVAQNTEALCTDGLDNSCNGLIDCADPLCQSSGFCCRHDPFADADDDKDVDQADFGVWQLCYTGSGDPLHIFNKDLCFCFDRDGDSDIDMADFNAFQKCYNGPNLPPAATCGQ